MHHTRALLASIAVAAMVIAGCGSAATSGGGQDSTAASNSTGAESGDAAGTGVTIVVTTSILGDVVGNIVGEDASVEVIMGPGVDPHGFSPSAAQAQSIREADLVIANGLQLEESLQDAMESAEQDGANAFRVGEELDPIPFTARDDHDGEGDEHDEAHDDHDDEATEAHSTDKAHDDHDHGAYDPHVWLDAQRMAEGATLIAGAIAQVDDTLDDAEWDQRGRDYADEVLALDEEVVGLVAVVPDDQRQMVTNHDSFGYFADRYGFEIIGTVIPGTSTQVDTSAASFVDLAGLIVDQDVPAIFAETTSSDRLAQALASEVGRDVAIVELYSGALGEPGSGAETYVDLMRLNAEAIAGALG